MPWWGHCGRQGAWHRALLLAGASLSATAADALDGVWVGPGNDWTTGTNWSSSPTVPDNTATFTNNGAPTAVVISGPISGALQTTSINTIRFDAGAPSSTITLNQLNGVFNINIGIANSSASLQRLALDGVITTFNFNNTSTAGNADFRSNVFGNHFINFNDFSAAGNATINTAERTGIFFHNASTAGNAIITAAFVNFTDASSAGHAIINIGGLNPTLNFSGISTAADATINFGIVNFTNASTGGNASITALTSLSFQNNSTPGQARLIAGLTTTAVDFSATSGPTGDHKIAAGSIEGPGNFLLGANQLTVGSNNLSTTVSGVMSDCTPTCLTPSAGGSLVKVGSGTLTLSGANTYTGPTAINAGTLSVGGSISGPVTVNNGGTLGGNGTVGSTTINSGGVLSPGNSIGTITINGNLVLGAGAIYHVEVSPSAAAPPPSCCRPRRSRSAIRRSACASRRSFRSAPTWC